MSTQLPNPYESPGALAALTSSPDSPASTLPMPRVWTVVVTFLGAVVFSFGLQILMGVGLVVYLLISGSTPQKLQDEVTLLMTSPGVFTVMVIIGPGPLGAVAILAAWLSPHPLRERLGLVPVKCSRSIYPLSMIGSILPLTIGLALAYALTWLVPSIPVDETAKHLYEQMTLGWAIPFVVVIGLVPGFCEEFLFRGYMQKRLTERFGPSVSIAVVSVLFGIAHVMPHTIIFATVLGLFFGVVAWKSGSIWPCICCHAFVNSGLNAWRMVIKFGEVPEQTQTIVTISAVIVGTICFIAALWVLWRGKEKVEVFIA